MAFWGKKEPPKGSMLAAYEGEDSGKATTKILWERFLFMRFEPGVLREITIHRIHAAIERIIQEEQPELGCIQVRAVQNKEVGDNGYGFEINMKVTGTNQ